MANISTFQDLIQRYKRTWREYTHHTESSVSVMSQLNALLPSMGGGTLGPYKKQLSLGAIAAFLITMATQWATKKKDENELWALGYLLQKYRTENIPHPCTYIEQHLIDLGEKARIAGDLKKYKQSPHLFHFETSMMELNLYEFYLEKLEHAKSDECKGLIGDNVQFLDSVNREYYEHILTSNVTVCDNHKEDVGNKWNSRLNKWQNKLRKVCNMHSTSKHVSEIPCRRSLTPVPSSRARLVSHAFFSECASAFKTDLTHHNTRVRSQWMWKWEKNLKKKFLDDKLWVLVHLYEFFKGRDPVYTKKIEDELHKLGIKVPTGGFEKYEPYPYVHQCERSMMEINYYEYLNKKLVDPETTRSEESCTKVQDAVSIKKAVLKEYFSNEVASDIVICSNVSPILKHISARNIFHQNTIIADLKNRIAACGKEFKTELTSDNIRARYQLFHLMSPYEK